MIRYNEYDVSCTILDDGILSSEVLEIALNALIGGQFEFPKEIVLVSGVYAVSVSKPLVKPIRLEIQHCVNLKTQAQANCLHFVRAPYSCTTLPYQFTLIEGGQFNPGSRYGSINMTPLESFYLFAIVAEKNKQPQENNMEITLHSKALSKQSLDELGM